MSDINPPTTDSELARIISIESILIELLNKEEWSSRVEAERIYDVAHGRSNEKIKKPWEHFAVNRRTLGKGLNMTMQESVDSPSLCQILGDRKASDLAAEIAIAINRHVPAPEISQVLTALRLEIGVGITIEKGRAVVGVDLLR